MAYNSRSKLNTVRFRRSQSPLGKTDEVLLTGRFVYIDAVLGDLVVVLSTGQVEDRLVVNGNVAEVYLRYQGLDEIPFERWERASEIELLLDIPENAFPRFAKNFEAHKGQVVKIDRYALDLEMPRLPTKG